jgi:3-oxoisoapionate decarboxylase
VKLGISTYAYTWSIGVKGYTPRDPVTAGQFLQNAARLNIPVVQIADNLPLHLLPDTEIDALADSAVRLGIQVEVGTRGIAAPHLRQYLALAQRFNSPILRVVMDAPGQHYSPEEALRVLRPQRAAFEQAGVMLAIENHDRLPAAVLARMVQDLGPTWAGACLDTVNSLGVPEGPAAVVEALGPWVVNLHVKDFAVARAPHLMGFTVEGRPAGRGQLDVPWLLRSLGAHGRQFSAILELWTPPEATLEQTIETEQRWVRESIEFLGPLLDGCPGSGARGSRRAAAQGERPGAGEDGS